MFVYDKQCVRLYVSDFIALEILESVLSFHGINSMCSTHHSGLQSPRSFWPVSEIESSARTILVPSATRLKMSLTSSSGSTKKFQFFSLAVKKWMRSRKENYKALLIHFTSGPDGGKFSGALYEKSQKWRPFLIYLKES